MRERVFARPQCFIPDLLRRGLGERRGYEFVPHVWRDSTFSADASGESVQEVKSTSYLPAAEITGRCASPDVCGESRTRGSDFACDLDDSFRFHAAFFGCVLGCELGIDLLDFIGEPFEGAGK